MMCGHVVQIPRSELPASWGSACTTTVMQFIFRSRERRNENDQIILLSHAVIIIRFWSKTSRRWPRILKRKKDPEKRKRFPLFYTEGRYFLILVLIPKKQLCIYFFTRNANSANNPLHVYTILYSTMPVGVVLLLLLLVFLSKNNGFAARPINARWYFTVTQHVYMFQNNTLALFFFPTVFTYNL